MRHIQYLKILQKYIKKKQRRDFEQESQANNDSSKNYNPDEYFKQQGNNQFRYGNKYYDFMDPLEFGRSRKDYLRKRGYINEEMKFYYGHNLGSPFNNWSIFFWSVTLFFLSIFFIQMLALQYKMAEIERKRVFNQYYGSDFDEE